MRWTCPHCRTELAAQEPPTARTWIYVRCSSCTGSAMVERASGRAYGLENTGNPEHSPEKLFSNDEPPADEIPDDPPAPGLLRRLLRNKSAWVSGTAMIIAAVGLLSPDQRSKTPPANQTAAANADPQDRSPLLASDTLHENAMAPLRAPADVAPIAAPPIAADPAPAQAPAQDSTPQLIAKLRRRALETELRSGPGRDYPVLGNAKPAQAYPVIEWKNRWFKVATGKDSSAWIHYDALELHSR